MYIHISFILIEGRLCIRFKRNDKRLISIWYHRCITQTSRNCNCIGSLSDGYFFPFWTGYNIQLCCTRYSSFIFSNRNHNRSFSWQAFCRIDTAPANILTTQLSSPLISGLKTDTLWRSSFSKAKTLFKNSFTTGGRSQIFLKLLFVVTTCRECQQHAEAYQMP